jgi:hypothetical protein
MAYEPAWLAGQIATVYLPWLFASLLTRLRVTRFKWLEMILLGFAILLLLATFSRGGLLTVAGALPAHPAPGVSPPAGASGGEQRADDTALDQFKAGSYGAAIASFAAFVAYRRRARTVGAMLDR